MRKILTKLSNLYYTIKRTYQYNLTPHDFKEGFKNLFSFFRVVWTWRDWDYTFFLRVVIFMLKKMEKRFMRGHHTNCETDAKNMRIARLLLERVLEDDYHNMVFKNHDRKWGELDLSSEVSHLDVNGDPVMYELIFSRPNANTTELKKQERTEYRRLMQKPEDMRRRDLEYAMDIISKQLLCWWD